MPLLCGAWLSPSPRFWCLTFASPSNANQYESVPQPINSSPLQFISLTEQSESFPLPFSTMCSCSFQYFSYTELCSSKSAHRLSYALLFTPLPFPSCATLFALILSITNSVVNAFLQYANILLILPRGFSIPLGFGIYREILEDGLFLPWNFFVGVTRRGCALLHI